MGPDIGADDTEAEPEPALGTAAVATVEPVPDSRLISRRDADARVRNRERRGPVGAADCDATRAPLGRVLDRVVDEVRDRLPQPIAIGRHGNVLAVVDPERDALVLGDILVELDDLADEAAERNFGERQAQRPG